MWSTIVLMLGGVVVFGFAQLAVQEGAAPVVALAAVERFQKETDHPEKRGVLEIVAPIILDVSEDGKSIGTTIESKLSLRPGKHVLTLSNRSLGYTSTHTVKIEPGEAKTIKLDPRAAARLNATPWAEVWMKGKKLGETPLVHKLPLGTHELVFKHPRFGERRVTTTVRADAALPVSVDMREIEVANRSHARK